ncbi:calcium-binding protein [Puniceibacterium sp. IMCC21224]|uniref:calcium-binding protein n=1 Tax=Puniceibacterium sp. IMCC21224 TaxID=1618204 RepID=UPI00065D2C88|nr:calcium-binding protein [Puniceibacterium sp. IMCC21224]KMK63976.1 Ca2+-binding protein, RTX toxin [Puniceibacterium sp. IMCC21224]
MGTSLTGSFAAPSSTVTLTRIETAAGLRLAVTDHTFGATQTVNVTGAGAAQIVGTIWHTPESRIAVNVEGAAGSLPTAVIGMAQQAWAAGDVSGHLAYLGTGALQAQAASVLAAGINGQSLLFVAPQNGSGITSFVVNANGTLGARQVRADTDAAYLDKPSDLTVIETNSGSFLYAGSASEHGLSGYRIGAGGALSEVVHLGRDQSLPVQTVTALDSAEINGRDFLIVAASGSSSLTVLEVADNGTLRAVDQVIDDLNTRFAGAAQLEVVTVEGHVFVLVAGSDDGVSLFRLTPQGWLVHVQSLADSDATALAGVSALGAQAVTGGFEVLVTAANEPGASLFRYDFASPGLVAHAASGGLTGGDGDDMLSLGAGNGTITGGAGDDILADGTGSDRLVGGAGADTFVLRPDGQRDVIADIDPAQDVLDLSGWAFLYSADQITVQTTSWGAVLRFGDEELELRGHDGRGLDAGAVAQLLPPLLSHVRVVTGPLLVAAAEVDPDPFPDTVPGSPALPVPALPVNVDPDPTPVPDPEPQPDTTPKPQAGGTMVEGSDSDDTLTGGSGADIMLGRDGHDLLRGNAGNDNIAASGGNDAVWGGDGHDNIGGGTGNDTIKGQDGNDTLGGGQGNDEIEGGDGKDVASGGPGDDLIEGGAGDDVLAGSFGNDTVQGEDGNDNIGGGSGRDRLTGGPGNDTLGGGEGDDTVKGGEGHDFLAGGGRHDLLLGEDGQDTLNGGTGNDTLTGGAGADVFVFNQFIAGEVDVITDFGTGADVLRLSGVAGATKAARFDALDITDAGDGVEIRYGGHLIVLDGMSADDLDLSDFLF